MNINTNTLRESTNTNMLSITSPKALAADDSTRQQPKTPLKKEDLEKIAKQLKHKLARASIAAKQSMSPTTTSTSTQTLHPTHTASTSSNSAGSALSGGPSLSLPSSNASARSSASPSRISPLKYMIRKLSNTNALLFGSSPNGKSPTLMKTPAAVFLSSSPLKHSTLSVHDKSDDLESPTKHSFHHNHHRDLASSPIAFSEPDSNAQDINMSHDDEPRMTLQPIVQPPSTPPRTAAILKPSPALQTTPGKKLTVSIPQTPTQPSTATRAATGATGAPQGDNEGADLLMYLATSPSPAKPPPNINFLGATPRSSASKQHNANNHNHNHNHNHNNFIAPAPPLTPKRPIVTTARTPQNRLTPLVNLSTGASNNINNITNGINGNLFPGAASGLPSSGLMLTPAGFNMSDYFNFFTPLPGGGSVGHNMGNKFLKTPDLSNLQGNSSLNQVARQKVDGKMINFDKVGFLGGNEQPKEH